MQVFRHLEELPSELGRTALTVGNFDGVHRAHQHVLREVVARARELHATSLAVTFDPHPVRILHPNAAPPLITPLPIKLRLLASTGLDAVLLLPFTRDLSLLTPRQFAEEILHRALHAREVHEGFNFRFGRKAKGDVQQLTEFGREFGFDLKVYPEMCIRGHSVSSSRVRELIAAEGDVSDARHLLGRSFSIISNPGRGRGFGAKYTVPTINLSRYDELVPRDGVYITRTRVAEECFDSVTNVGNRPTFGAESFAIETHLLNFHPLELTPETEVELFFLRRLRPEIKFPSVEELRRQIGADVNYARRYFHLLQRDNSI
ncbi:MAG TPA: bifunctional riboflavin kinase/FAD synthetase [Terriglobales bacterium]|nr:bifunctional riboflavin kinase/FAD synthetase [Terriglobales bacterium]